MGFWGKITEPNTVKINKNLDKFKKNLWRIGFLRLHKSRQFSWVSAKFAEIPGENDEGRVVSLPGRGTESDG